MTKYPYVTRVEVIDDTGRAYVVYGASEVYTSLQDDERTLKVFLKGLDNNVKENKETVEMLYKEQ